MLLGVDDLPIDSAHRNLQTLKRLSNVIFFLCPSLPTLPQFRHFQVLRPYYFHNTTTPDLWVISTKNSRLYYLTSNLGKIVCFLPTSSARIPIDLTLIPRPNKSYVKRFAKVGSLRYYGKVIFQDAKTLIRHTWVKNCFLMYQQDLPRSIRTIIRDIFCKLRHRNCDR